MLHGMNRSWLCLVAWLTVASAAELLEADVFSPKRSQHDQNNHVTYKVNRLADSYVVTFRFKDHKGGMQEFIMRYPRDVTERMISRFGIPSSMFEPFVATPEVLRERDLVLKEGLFKTQSHKLVIDLNSVVDYYLPFCKPIAEKIVEALSEYGTDSRQERIEMAMKFVQDIPYGTPPNDDENWYTAGFYTPPEVIINMYGDCDSKAVLFAGILVHLLDQHDLLFLKQPKHLLTAVRDRPASGQIYVNFKGETYVIAETAGPGRPNLGQEGGYFKRELYSVQPLELASTTTVIPFGDRRNIGEGYDPFVVRKGKPTAGFGSALYEIMARKAPIRDIAFAPRGGWAILYGDSEYVARGIPETAAHELCVKRLSDERITSVAFTYQGGWLAIQENGNYTTKDIPPEMSERIEELYTHGSHLKRAAFDGAGNWVLLYGRNGYATLGVQESLNRALSQLNDRNEVIRDVSLMDRKGWAILHERGVTTWGISNDVSRKLSSLIEQGRSVDGVYFTGNGGYVIVFDKLSCLCKY